MMRTVSYNVFLIPGIEKMVLVNDEEGNATFIIHNVPATEDSWEEFADLTKNELKALGNDQVNIVIYQRSKEAWKEKMEEVLTSSPLKVEKVGLAKREKNSGHNEELEPAPEGWITTNGLTKILQVAGSTVEKKIEPYKKTHPEWFEVYLNKRKRPVEHYHPNLVTIITKEIASRPGRAPEGWMIPYGLSEILPVSRGTIKRIVQEYRKQHPEWFGYYLDKTKKPTEHFHPELIEIIKQEIASRPEKAPEGWLTNYALSIILKTSTKSIRQAVDKYYEKHPEWFKMYADTHNHLLEYYHPKLIEIIKQEIASRPEKAPEGWLTNRGLSQMLEIDRETASKMAKIYREEHPEWFEYYLDKLKRIREHYHPDLITIITREIEEERNKKIPN